MGNVVDITQQKKAEDLLRLEKSRFKGLIHYAPFGMVLVGDDKSIIYVNPEFRRLFGYDPDEIKTSEEWVNLAFSGPDNRPQFIRSWFNFAGKDNPCELRPQIWPVKCRDGNEKIIRFRSVRLSKSEFLVTCEDVTESKAAEKALQESEERYRTLVENLPEAVAIHQRGKIVYVNPAGAQLLGATPTQNLIGNDAFDLIHPAHANRIAEGLKMLKENGVTPLTEAKMVKLTGEIVDVEITTLPFLYDGRPALLTVGKEITQRKKAEEQILRLNEELEQRVQCRTAELEASNKELEAFAYSVSHDLRAPLRTMDGFSQVLLEDYANSLNDQAKDFLNRIRTGSQKMAQLIDDLLKLSRITRSEMRSETVNLSRIAQSVASDLKNLDPERKVIFKIQPCLTTTGDERLLRLALENLLQNAWKFTGNREVGEIEFGSLPTTSLRGRTVYFIRDNGAGFDMTYSGKLFTAFQRLHGISEFPGTGIGLATVHRIILRHGGRVWAEGRVNEGASFILRCDWRLLKCARLFFWSKTILMTKR